MSADPGAGLDGFKDWWTSKSILASLIGAAVALLGIAGVAWNVDVDRLATALSVLLPFVVLLGTSLVSWYGRLTATRRIGPPPAQPAAPVGSRRG